jgi:hypothetical protein
MDELGRPVQLTAADAKTLRDNYLLQVKPGDLQPAPARPGRRPDDPGHPEGHPWPKEGERGGHGMSKETYASILNSPERIFTGVNENDRDVDVYYKGDTVVITEAGNKTLLITGFGKLDGAKKIPRDPSRWVNKSNWKPITIPGAGDRTEQFVEVEFDPAAPGVKGKVMQVVWLNGTRDEFIRQSETLALESLRRLGYAGGLTFHALGALGVFMDIREPFRIAASNNQTRERIRNDVNAFLKTRQLDEKLEVRVILEVLKEGGVDGVVKGGNGEWNIGAISVIELRPQDRDKDYWIGSQIGHGLGKSDHGVGVHDLVVDGWPIRSMLRQKWGGEAILETTEQRTPLAPGYVTFVAEKASPNPRVIMTYGTQRFEGDIREALPELISQDKPLQLSSGGSEKGWRASAWFELSDLDHPKIKGEIISPAGAKRSFVLSPSVESGAVTGQSPVTLLDASAAPHVTTFKLMRTPLEHRNIVAARISAQGDTIVYTSYQGTHVLNAADGKVIKSLSTELSQHPDISEDGKTVAWYDKNGLHVCGSDGSNLRTTKAEGLRDLRLTPAGDQIIVLESNHSLSRYATTGATLERHELIDPKKLNAFLGEKDTAPLGFIAPEGLSSSDNGKRFAFRYKDRLLGMDEDGNVKVLKKLDWKGSSDSQAVSISGDGQIVAARVGPDKDRQQNWPSLLFMTWEGKDLPTAYINEQRLHGGGGERITLTRDGRKLAFDATFGQLHLFDTQRQEVSTPTFAVPLYQARGASINQDATRASLIIDGHTGHQVVSIDSRPATLTGVPTLVNIHFSSHLVSAATPLIVSAQSEPGVTIRGFLLRDGVNLRGAGWNLRDEARKDEQNAQYHTYSDKLAYAATPGPLTCRLIVSNEEGNSLAIDLEGFVATETGAR